MPHKSLHGKRKLPRSKRIKGGQDVLATSTAQQAVHQPEKPALQSQVSAPSISKPRPMIAKSDVTQYRYVVAELRRIGILAGVILVILVILALVFS